MPGQNKGGMHLGSSTNLLAKFEYGFHNMDVYPALVDPGVLAVNIVQGHQHPVAAHFDPEPHQNCA